MTGPDAPGGPGWRIPGATVLLVTGAALVGDPLWYWQVIGALLLIFVPALIFDAVVHAVSRRRP